VARVQNGRVRSNLLASSIALNVGRAKALERINKNNKTNGSNTMKTKTTHFGSIAAKILAVLFGFFVMDVSAEALDKVTVDNVFAEAGSEINLDTVGCITLGVYVSAKTESTLGLEQGVPNSLPVTSKVDPIVQTNICLV
jgi:hypothetical protein